MPRPSDLVKYPELIEKFLNFLRGGAYTSEACDACEISEDNIYEWLNKGNRDEKAGKHTHYCQFAKAYKKAKAEARLFHIKNIRDHSKDNWQASAWYLERTAAKDWGRKVYAELSGDKEKPIKIIFEAVDGRDSNKTPDN